MIRTLILIISIGIICLSCGKKGNPVFQAQKQNNLTILSSV